MANLLYYKTAKCNMRPLATRRDEQIRKKPFVSGSNGALSGIGLAIATPFAFGFGLNRDRVSLPGGRVHLNLVSV